MPLHGGGAAQGQTFRQNNMKTATKKTQCQRLLAYLRKNRKGITTMEAFRELGITCVHKRIAELEDHGEHRLVNGRWDWIPAHNITRTRETTATGSTVTRYKLAR